MPVFFVIAHKIVFKFHAQPKLAHIRVISSGRWSKTQNDDQIEFTSFPDCNILPFLKGFKKTGQNTI